MASIIYLIGLFAFASEASLAPFFQNSGRAFPWQALWNPKLFLYLFVGTLGIIALACFYKIATLSEGAFKVATGMGGRRVEPNSSDPDERRLLNVVEEM